MEKFNRYNHRYDNYGDRRSEEELDQMELEFNNQQKERQTKIMRSILIGVAAFFTLTFLFFSSS